MIRDRLSRLSPSRFIITFAVICGLALGAFWALTVWRGHGAALAVAEAISARISVQLREHAERSFQDIGLLAERVREQLARRGGPGDQSYLDGYVRALPQVTAVAVYGPSGEIVTTAGIHAAETLQGVNLPALHPFLSPNLVRFGSGDRDLAYVERLAGLDGEFLGTFYAVIDLGYFANFYARIDLGAKGVVGLADGNGGVIVQHPAAAEGWRQNPVPIREVAGEKPVRVVSPVDGVDRIVTHARVEPFPVEIFVGFATEDVLVPWRGELREGAGIAAGVALLLLLMARLTWGAARHKEDLARRLEQALAEKQTLFQEMHHRVKNNLQIVSSMVAMQALQMHSQDDAEALQRLSSRIHSISALHQTLYEKDQADSVEFQALLEKITGSLAAAYDPDGRIRMRVAAEGSARLDQALPVALIVNEVVSNSFKHAFPDGRRGRVDIALGERDGRMVLEIRDDGAGLREDALRQGGIGTALMKSLAAQIGGEMVLGSNGGTVFRLSFPRPAAASAANRP